MPFPLDARKYLNQPHNLWLKNRKKQSRHRHACQFCSDRVQNFLPSQSHSGGMPSREPILPNHGPHSTLADNYNLLHTARDEQVGHQPPLLGGIPDNC